MESFENKIYNPLDKTNIARSIKDQLLRQKIIKLPPERFYGAGIYAIYYTGDFAAYKKLTKIPPEDEKAIPIYIGKAVPAGSRKGVQVVRDYSKDTSLYRRLVEHTNSIKEASNLKLDDFRCRYLLVDDIWIPLGESLLIETFKPVWNVIVDGFGHHDQGKARREQMKSAWDTLHPGRSWAKKVKTPYKKSKEEIIEEVIKHLENL